MNFEIQNFISIAVHSIAKEMPALVTLAISETKAMFADDPKKLTDK